MSGLNTFYVSQFPSVRDAFEACEKQGGGVVYFPEGIYESATIRLPSNCHLQFETGAILKAAESGFEEPEDNPWDAYQDFGHSHFDNGLLVAKGAENITISGAGLITGDGRLRAGDDARGGVGGKLLVFKECRNITIRDITLTQGGHFTLLANGVEGLSISDIRIEGQRDGANIIGCKHVTISDSFFSGHDDALAFKSDYALGRTADTEYVDVRNCTLQSQCNGIQFGTETVSNFREMHFENIHCLRGAKSAIGILSCDGAIIEDISFKNMILEECCTFFFIKIADRGRRPDYRQGVDTGAIRRISFTNIEGRGPMRWRDLSVTPTIMGMAHRPIEDIRFTNVHLTIPGGHPATEAGSYVEDTGFFWSRFRTDSHPSYGWWMRDVTNVTFNNCSVAFTEPDGRPAVVVEDGQDVVFSNFSATRSVDHPYDIRLAGNSTGELLASEGCVMLEPEAPENASFNHRHTTFKGFRLNKTEFSQVPFWFWNDELSVDEITRQMDDFQMHGVHAAVIHPRAGLPQHLGWMSDDLLEFMRFAIDHARGRNMWVFLYDEAMYPSGSSGGQVVAENPAYACRGLVQIDLTTACPGDTVQTVSVGETGVILAENQTLVAEVIRQHDGHRIAIVDTPIGSTIRGVHFVEDDPRRRDDHKEVPENHPLAGDLLNPEAMQCFIRLVYQRFFDEFGGHFGKTIKGIFTDEPGILGKGRPAGINPRPGTTGILEHVNAYLGYDFTPHLPALWDNNEPDAQRYRSDYNRAIRQRLQETYYKPISDWCEAHGIALTGHPEKSDDIGMLRHFQIPGQDVVLHYIEPGNDSSLVGPHSTMAKCAASAMLHLGRRRNLNEFAGAYGHDLTFREYRWLALWLLVRGCNMLAPHAFYYSTRGPRIDERPRDVGPNSPWWDQYKDFTEMTGKLCWLNTDSDHCCEVAILGQDDRLPWESARICFENQIDFNYLEDHHLTSGVKLDTDGIHIASMTYSRLVIEEGYESTCGPEADEIITQLEHAGRLIVWSPSEGKNGLLDRLPSAVSVTPPHVGLRVRRVRKEGIDYVIVFNESDRPFDGCIEIESLSSGRHMLVDSDEQCPWTPQTQVLLEPHDCMVIVGD